MGPAWTLYKSQRPRGLFPCPREKVGLATAHTSTRSFPWVDLWSPSWQEQACERPEPCTWAGLRQGRPGKRSLKTLHWSLCEQTVSESMGPAWTPYKSQRPRGLLACPREKGGLATAHTTTWSFTWTDLGSSSWQKQVSERPEPCTWSSLRQGWWPSKASINPSRETCVDIH